MLAVLVRCKESRKVDKYPATAATTPKTTPTEEVDPGEVYLERGILYTPKHR